jgi:uncharacterized phage protein gp47/JayE
MLDHSGFTRRSYQDILTELIAQAQNMVAPDIETGTDSIFGSMLRVMAYELAKEEEQQEAVWFNGFISQATGISLDHLAANIGLLRNPAANAMVTLTLSGRSGTAVPEQTLFGTSDNINFFTIESGVIPSNGGLDTDGKTELGTLELNAVSVDQTAKANVSAGRITQIVEAVAGVRSVINSIPATGGIELETDNDLRSRLIDNYKKSANGTMNSLITSVENVTGVQMAQVIVNNTMETDRYGNAPKSVHFYVAGGSDYDVANAIFNAVVAGVATVGKTSVNVPTISGTSAQTINFDRPSQKVVDISVTLLTNENFSISGNEDVKNVIENYILTLRIGETLYISRLINAIYSISGISDVTITLNVGGVPETGTSVVPEQFEYIVSGDVGVSE